MPTRIGSSPVAPAAPQNESASPATERQRPTYAKQTPIMGEYVPHTDVNPVVFNPVLSAVETFRSARIRGADHLSQLFGGNATVTDVTVDTSKPPLLTGRVLHKGDAGWADARRNFCARIAPETVEPRSIVFAQSAQDVSNAARYAKETGIPFRIRSGRHSYEAYSLVKNGIVIDVSEINHVVVDPQTGLATIGAGAQALDISQKLAAYGRELPVPTFATVGIAGAALGGGVGFTSRKHGLTADQMVSAKLIDANGHLITASATENPDLFWALRGGGNGNFGAVVEFTFKTYPMQTVAAFEVTWDWSQFDDIVDAWQRWAPNSDDNMSTALDLRADGTIKMFGQYTPDPGQEPDGVRAAMQQLFDKVPPKNVGVTYVPGVVAARAFGQVSPVNPYWRNLRKEQIFKSTSSTAPDYMPREAISQIRHDLETSPYRLGGKNYDTNMLRLLSGGGAAGRPGAEDTAAYHRDAKFILQYDAYWDEPQDEAASIEWIEGMRARLGPYTKGAYVNYHDSQIKDPLVAYHGPNLKKLVDVKAKYDPDNVFNYPQSLPTKLTPELEAALAAWPQRQA